MQYEGEIDDVGNGGEIPESVLESVKEVGGKMTQLVTEPAVEPDDLSFLLLLQDPHGGKREQTPGNSPLTSSCCHGVCKCVV